MNIKKTEWDKFTNELGKSFSFIILEPRHYSRFVNAVIATQKMYVSRGYIKEYIPGWNEHYENFLRTITTGKWWRTFCFDTVRRDSIEITENKTFIGQEEKFGA